MYTFCIIMIAIASILLILAVLVQSPKSGMAANFGAANQTMGVRQTTDFLEKFTWAMVAAIVFFCLLSVTAMPKETKPEATNSTTNALMEGVDSSNPEAQVETGTEDLTIGAVATEEAAPATEAVEAAPAAEATTQE